MLGTLGLAIYCVVTLLLSSTPHGALAQDPSFSIPTGWQKTSSPLTPSQRAGIAKDAISLLLPQINASIGTISVPSMDPSSASAALFAVLALNDWINGNTAYRSVVLSSMQTFGNLNPNFLNSPYVRRLGLFSLYVHESC
ncbi:hypothetical protein OF83DRAFT_1136334 [Amylostereum chailletii]|nr:hypothetical protein OF83DRAFT_1136334 [Amylostereum chailletii]